jgi:hypothetical protein
MGVDNALSKEETDRIRDECEKLQGVGVSECVTLSGHVNRLA